MKKFISIILAAVFCFSAIPDMDVKAADVNQRAGTAYAYIIRSYIEAYEIMNSDEVRYDWEGSLVNGEFAMASQYRDAVFYRIMDYNNDGAPELFIGLCSTDSDCGTIYDVYTFYKEKAVQLMKDIGERAGSCVFCKNGIIKDAVSSTAFRNDTTFYKLPKHSNKLFSIIELIESKDFDDGRVAYTKQVNGEATKISEKKYKKLYKKYDKPIKETFYEADSRAVDHIKHGVFHYSGQKKWKIKTGE